jgi:dTDP-4-amino-4,6-dideoxy-D-glucose acyltransferase
MNYTRDELEQIGFARIGSNVTIHITVELFSPQRIHLGDNVRIDCFSLLSAGEEGIHIGNNVHLAASTFIFGGGGKVVLENFSGLSSRVSIYTATDDYSEGYLTNPTVPDKYKKVKCGPVTLRKHAIVGAGSVIMPGVEVGVAASIGALSFVYKKIDDFSIVLGSPARVIGRRSEKILEMERIYTDEMQQG